MAKGWIVAALIAGIAPLAAQAQDRDLDSEPPTGKVFSGDVPEGGGAARYLLTLAPGQAVDLTAAPIAGSDPKVQVFDATSGELVAENDDSSGSLASNVRLYSERGQRVRIEVTNASVEDSNAAMRFDLVLRPSDYRPRPPVDLALGESHEDTLGSGDERLYHFEGRGGQLWDLAVSAAPGSGLDPALEVFAGDVAGGEVLGEDDDGGGGLNARLRFLVPSTGTYTVRVHGVGQSEGGFTLSAGRTVAAPLRELELGEAGRGTLSAGEQEHLYRLSPAARRAIASGSGPLVVEMIHTGDSGGEEPLDPTLEVGFETPLGFSSLITDDDSGGDNNARLALDPAELSGPWLEALRIKAASFLETSGDYELTVRRGD